MTKHILLFIASVTLLATTCRSPRPEHQINRENLVKRHLPRLNQLETLSPFTVGNGEFAFTADITGLQSLADVYETDIPLTTQSQWGWHTLPDIGNYRQEQTWEYIDTYGRPVPYASIMHSSAASVLRANPHRLHLGRIGLKNNGDGYSNFSASDITNIDQTMDIWQGIIKSSFNLRGHKMNVETCSHPLLDQLAARIQSPDLSRADLCIGFDFPYGAPVWGKTAYDWDSPDRHTSSIVAQEENVVTIERQLDSTVYYVTIQWDGAAEFLEIGPHSFALVIKSENLFEFSCLFSQAQDQKSNDAVAEIFEMSKEHWVDFWTLGGAVDLSKSSDPRAMELERRVVLSQYLTAIQCSGSLPPQETGLTVNSWFGKYHLEMHWWHAVHFVLWGRPALLEKSLPWYETILPVAREKAALQGYDGVRWPKMSGPDGVSSPSSVGEFLIWQQPHPIYFAELLYRFHKDDSILTRYKDIVFQTADFMASYAYWEKDNSRYVLGPPLIPAQEIYRPLETKNPAFELSYWAFGLSTAQNWRERLGLDRVQKWDHVLDHLAELPEQNGLYQNAETALNTFEDEFNRNDHPTVLGTYGMLPNKDVDVGQMQRTLEKVMASWNWLRTWGWDYPMVAMTAARVGRPDIAVDALLMDVQKNTYLNNGHNYQSDRLPLYLPGNGGLLTAIAMMAAGWDGAPEIPAPGFPQDGSWIVEFEGLERMP